MCLKCFKYCSSMFHRYYRQNTPLHGFRGFPIAVLTPHTCLLSCHAMEFKFTSTSFLRKPIGKNLRLSSHERNIFEPMWSIADQLRSIPCKTTTWITNGQIYLRILYMYIYKSFVSHIFSLSKHVMLHYLMTSFYSSWLIFRPIYI